MPRGQSLANMSVDALLQMRSDIAAVLSTKADALRKELASLGETITHTARSGNGKPRGVLAGTKVAPKYRGPNGETWAGRGAEPLWLREAMKGGKKREAFLIDKSALPAKRGRPAKAARRGRPPKKKAA